MSVEEIHLDEAVIERMAALNHQIYCEMMRANGYTYGPTRDDVLRTRPLLTDYAAIPETNKQSNRNVVASIPEKIHAINCIITTARSDAYLPTTEEIEFLAKMEHERYVVDMIKAGWRFGRQYNESTKENPTLIPWDQYIEGQFQEKYPEAIAKLGPGPLSEEERQKDRNQVKGYVTLLERSGFSLIKKP